VSARAANRRIRLIGAVLTLAFAACLARAGWVQVIRASSLSKQADAQQTETITTPAPRGAIDDRNGVELAANVDTITIFADPKLVSSPAVEARKAGSILGLDDKSESDLAVALSNRASRFTYVARKAPIDVAKKIERLNLDGFGFLHESKRSYPQTKLAAQVLGFASVDNKGIAGLELAYDKALSGKDGEETVVRDPEGRVIDVRSSKDERPGADLTLTLDNVIQLDLQRVLAETLKRTGATSTSAIVLDPGGGQVLAMATAPAYNANDAWWVPQEYQRNRPVTDNYEPGSTFKLVTVAAALSEGLVTPQTSFTLPYSIRVADKTIHDAHWRPTRRMTVKTILTDSSNVGAATIATKLLGEKRLYTWIKRFGFGRITGIDFPGEIKGTVPALDHWYGSAAGTIPIGQGIAVTPIQLAAAYAAVSNGGVWVQPHFLERIGDKPAPTPKRRRVVSSAVAASLMDMLTNVVDEGTGTAAEISGYTVAGKTGTAEKVDPATGRYSGRYVASFVGIVPASKPRLVILVTVDEPETSIYGGVVAAPAFQEIALDCLRYLEIPPDKAG
jgi:cell division protein FtsI/penicillin-binding protein 2